MSDAMQRTQKLIEEAHALLKKAQSALDRSAELQRSPEAARAEQGYKQTLRLATDKERQEMEQRAQQEIDRIAHERLQGAEALNAIEPAATTPTRRRRPRQTV